MTASSEIPALVEQRPDGTLRWAVSPGVVLWVRPVLTVPPGTFPPDEAQETRSGDAYVAQALRDCSDPPPEGVEFPAVGVPCTLCYPSDRYPYTIIGVMPSRRAFLMQQDHAEMCAGSRGDGSAEYVYTRNPDGRLVTVRLTKYGLWRASDTPVTLGHRRLYLAPEL